VNIKTILRFYRDVYGSKCARKIIFRELGGASL
jgi:hypothetical protein